MAHEDEIARRRHEGKAHDHKSGAAHEGLGRDDGAHQKGPHRPHVFAAQEAAEHVDTHEACHQQEDRNTELGSGAVGEEDALSLPPRFQEKDHGGCQQKQEKAGRKELPAAEVPGDVVKEDAAGIGADMAFDVAVVQALLAESVPVEQRVRLPVPHRHEPYGKLRPVGGGLHL